LIIARSNTPELLWSIQWPISEHQLQKLLAFHRTAKVQ
jgi:hypothetical protein